jgi:hypothetical protein
LVIEEKPSLAPDMMRWKAKLDQFNLGTPEQKVKYAKYFHFKYAGKTGWSEFFDTDSALLFQHLAAPSKPSQSSVSSKDTPRKSFNTSTERSGRKDRPRPSGGAGGGARTPKKAQKRTPKNCFSRSDRSKGDCSFDPNCHFDHKCMSCGQDHAAASCPSWDQQKASALLLAASK